MASENELKLAFDYIPDRYKWAFAFVSIVLVDTFLTKMALQNSLAVEANPLLQPIVHEGRFTILIILKSMVMVTVILYAERFKEDRLTDRALVNFAFVVGLLIVVWNIVMVGGSLLLN